jgi:hypothetical protein
LPATSLSTLPKLRRASYALTVFSMVHRLLRLLRVLRNLR